MCPRTYAQVLSLPHAYAHNDYWHKRPLLDALDNGFTHVEADIYLRHARLVVSHNPPFLGHRRTLEDLYFRPLLQRFTSDGESQQSPLDTVVLMIDIKSKGVRTIKALNRLLERYKPVLTSCEDGKLTIRNLTLVITGHRPMGWLEKDGPRYLFVDADLNRLDHRASLPDLYITASCKYSRLISWKGRGQIPSSDQQRLLALVGRAHAMGAKVRLWGSPDKTPVWNFLMRCGVDLINTDRLVALRDYFIRNNRDDRSELELTPGQ
ncbi:phosphatidylinositol-specific phospholipase C/glycerophosphodiester phosphodiesterase family protein [Puia sp. P3]|uniref:phosphatidylinositol-specific phospholipase C/glycerophosphodiester phosphodiesterase family protein n=1 Tax=Puia sp. P3 TaxID=3423952 RepID=UPI003D67F660